MAHGSRAIAAATSPIRVYLTPPTSAKQNIPGTPITADHALTREHAVAKQEHATATLDHEHALVAARGIVDACATRNWHVVRAARMWNHVHVIVMRCPDSGPEVRRILKGVSQKTRFASTMANRSAGGPRKAATVTYTASAILTATQYVANQPNPLAQIVDMQVIAPSERRGSSPLT